MIFHSQGVSKNDLNKKVAIKTFQMPMKMYITREAETLARAAHKNVVHFLGLEQPAEMYVP